MGQQPYPYKRLPVYRYTFISDGKTKIKKLVTFAPTPVKNIYNLGFGDLSADGTIDYSVNSNNGDISKVLATVVKILKDFLKDHSTAKIIFRGSTLSRMALYRRIIKTYYEFFSKEFTISTLVETRPEYNEVTFDPQCNEEILAFFITRIY